MSIDIEFTDNSEEVTAAISAAALRALERIGLHVEGKAKQILTDNNSVDTGNLRNSINHKVDPSESAVYIGTNVEYAPYVELGTGIHAKGGRQTPWVYKDEKGNWHHTRGQEAQPFLKPAVVNSTGTIKNIVADEFKKAGGGSSGAGSSGGHIAADLIKALKKGAKTGKKIEKIL